MPATVQFQPTAQRSTHSAPQSVNAACIGRKDAAPLPIWLTADARALLERAVAEKPERTVKLSAYENGDAAELGYRGKAARALRHIWQDWFLERAAWCDAARPDMDLYDRRRSALYAYADKHSSDQLIGRMIAIDEAAEREQAA